TLKPAVAPVAGCRLSVVGCRLSGKGRGFRRSYATGRSAAHHGHHPQERRKPRPFPRPPTTPPVRAHLPTPPAEHTPSDRVATRPRAAHAAATHASRHAAASARLAPNRANAKIVFATSVTKSLFRRARSDPFRHCRSINRPPASPFAAPRQRQSVSLIADRNTRFHPGAIGTQPAYPLLHVRCRTASRWTGEP